MATKYTLEDGMWEAINAIEPGGFSGIYQLHVLDDEGKFLPIPRLLGMDPDGILYIGAGRDIASHLSNLRISISSAYSRIDPAHYGHLTFNHIDAHQTGKKIARIPRFVEKFRFDRLCLTVEQYNDVGKSEAATENGYYDLKTRLLREYEKQFGEKPALNAV